MEEGVSETKDDKKKYEEKEAECPDDTPPESTTMDGGKGVNNEKVGENVDLDELDESTCYDDKYYDIYDNEEENITEDSIFWVNTNKTIWEGRVIKIPFSDLPEDAKHLKLIGLIQKRKKGF